MHIKSTNVKNICKCTKYLQIGKKSANRQKSANLQGVRVGISTKLKICKKYANLQKICQCAKICKSANLQIRKKSSNLQKIWKSTKNANVIKNSGNSQKNTIFIVVLTRENATTDFRSSEKKTLKSGPDSKVFRAWISSFRHEEHGESKRRKTFVTNATRGKTLNPFSFDRKPVVTYFILIPMISLLS